MADFAFRYRLALPRRMDVGRASLPMALITQIEQIPDLVDFALFDATSSWQRPGEEDEPRVELRVPVVEIQTDSASAETAETARLAIADLAAKIKIRAGVDRVIVSRCQIAVEVI